MSIIAAGTTTTTALSSTGNTDGTLQFQVNGTTASVTLNTLGAVGVGASPNFGTSGQVLVSAGSTAAPTWGTAGTSTTATNLAGGTAGVLPFQTGTGATSFTAVGTSGQVLTSAGTGTPTWTTPSAGALVFLSSFTASGASTVDVETGFSSTYDNYMIVIDNFACSGNASGFVRFKSGGTYDAGSNYYYTNTNGGTTSASSSGVFNAYTAISTNGGFIVDIIGVNSGAGKIAISRGSAFQSGTPGVNSTSNYTTCWNNSSAMQGIRFYQGSGTISGTFKLYGIAKA